MEKGKLLWGGIIIVQMLVVKDKLISFRQLLIDLGKRLIEVFKPIKAEIKAEIKKINFQHKYPHIRVRGNQIIIHKNKNKKRYRNIARVKTLLNRWGVVRHYK